MALRLMVFRLEGFIKRVTKERMRWGTRGAGKMEYTVPVVSSCPEISPTVPSQPKATGEKNYSPAAFTQALIRGYYQDFALVTRTPQERIVNQVQDGNRARFCRCC